MRYLFILLTVLCLAGPVSAGTRVAVIGDTTYTGGTEGVFDNGSYAAILLGDSLHGMIVYTASEGDAIDSIFMYTWQGSGSIDLGVYDITTGDTNRVAVGTLTPSSTHQEYGVDITPDVELTAGNIYALAIGNETI